MFDLASLKQRRHRTTFLPFAPPMIGPEEKAEVLDTLDSGWLTTGPKTESFERRVAQYVGARYAVAVNSCTAALHLALAVHGIAEGDEVIMPTFTFASTAHVVMYQHARPVLVDIDLSTFNLDPEQVEKAITPQTRAIIPVHYAGQACDLSTILKIARRHNLVVIEDAAHAIGAEYRGRKLGGHGNIACFSFYATKKMTTGEGGMAVLDDPDLAEKLRVLSMYGIGDARRIWKRYAPRGSWFYDIQFLGYKYNMMDLQAALGLHQLAKLDDFIARRARFAAQYADAFADLKEIVLPSVTPEVRTAWHLYSILVRTNLLTVDRDRFIEELKEENIGSSVLFRPLHLHSFYRQALNYENGCFPNSEYAFEHILSLPISPIMTDEDVLDVIAAVRRIVARYRR